MFLSVQNGAGKREADVLSEYRTHDAEELFAAELFLGH